MVVLPVLSILNTKRYRSVPFKNPENSEQSFKIGKFGQKKPLTNDTVEIWLEK